MVANGMFGNVEATTDPFVSLAFLYSPEHLNLAGRQSGQCL
jgi:hypothetical protein